MLPALAEIVVGDPPDAWRAAGFTVADDGTTSIGAVRIRLVGRDQGKRIRSWSFRDLDPARLPDDGIDGLPTGTTDLPAPPAVEHPNHSRLIDHVVVLSPDGDRTLAAFAAVGLEALATRDTDTYGLPMRQTFLRAGEVILELIAPTEPTAPDDSVGPADGESPATWFGLAHTVDDLDATAALLGDALGRVKDAVQPGRRIATLRHRDLGMSVATAFMTPSLHG
jgi:hypothetical protein